jgi:hypothetical protein
MFDKLSKRVRILHAFFFVFEFANPSMGESNPSTLEYFSCAMAPLTKPSTDFASVARRALGVAGEASDASDHPDHLEIVNVSATTSSKSVHQKRRALRGRHSPEPRSLARQYPHQLAIHRLATRQRHQHFILCHHCNIHQHPRQRRWTY